MQRKDELFSRIITEFPQFQNSQIQYIGHGWENDVIIVDNSYVFRFPKTEHAIKTLEKELKTLSILAKYITACMLPEPKFISHKKDFFWYAIIPGASLQETKNVIDFPGVAKQLSLFLTELHSIPLHEFENLWYDTVHYSISEWYLSRHIQEKLSHDCKNLLTEKQLFNVLHLIPQFDNRSIPEKTFVHYDLNPDNIFIHDWKLSGIIDFSDADLFDPASEFARIIHFDKSFADEILKNYPNKSPDFLRRIDFYYKKYVLTHLAHICGKSEKKKQRAMADLWI